MNIFDRLKRAIGLGRFCANCGNKKPENTKDWKEYSTGCTSATDFGTYWLCPGCQDKYNERYNDNVDD